MSYKHTSYCVLLPTGGNYKQSVVQVRLVQVTLFNVSAIVGNLAVLIHSLFLNTFPWPSWRALFIYRGHMVREIHKELAKDNQGQQESKCVYTKLRHMSAVVKLQMFRKYYTKGALSTQCNEFLFDFFFMEDILLFLSYQYRKT